MESLLTVMYNANNNKNTNVASVNKMYGIYYCVTIVHQTNYIKIAFGTRSI